MMLLRLWRYSAPVERCKRYLQVVLILLVDGFANSSHSAVSCRYLNDKYIFGRAASNLCFIRTVYTRVCVCVLNPEDLSPQLIRIRECLLPYLFI
jgi:hypothetical protein